MMSLFLTAALVSNASAGVPPILETEWGQGGAWQAEMPQDAAGQATYPGCTTVAVAQVLFHYQHQASPNRAVSYVLDHDVTGAFIADGVLDLPARSHDWDAMARTERDSAAAVSATSAFLFDVGATLHAQFGDDGGTPATGKQLENAVRYQWGFDAISRRQMSVIAKDAFQYSDAEWAGVIRGELDAGRPVIHMALQADGDAGHAFVIDGYDDDGRVHVNWGWGGYANGWYDPNTLEDPSGRQWNRSAMIFRGLEPERGAAAALLGDGGGGRGPVWTGNGSLISKTSGSATGYGLTRDEAYVPADVPGNPLVLFQWEVDPSDGARLRVDAETGATTANLTYGSWSDRGSDRVFRKVSLPFVLDPARDGHAVDGAFFVVAVELLDNPGSGIVTAEATTATGSSTPSSPATPLMLDGRQWSGNASVISHSSGTRTGYGLTHDLTYAAPGAAPPVVFFQWEIDGRDGRRLTLDGTGTVEVSYGAWNGDRALDVRRTVTLPHVLDPASDGLPSADGSYLVVRVAFVQSPAQAVPVEATATR
jgi:hypothetical protein